MSRFQIIFDELRNITTIDLAHKTANILEKILWATIGIVGTIWAFFFIGSQFQMWNENPWLSTKADVDLSQLNYPAITFCSDGATKYAVAERLGNYIDPASMNRSQDITNLKTLILKQILPASWLTSQVVMAEGKDAYDLYCKKSRSSDLKAACEVLFFFCLYLPYFGQIQKSLEDSVNC